MKLEIKHLASYLPYGLKLKTEYGWCIMLTLNDWSVNGDCDESLCYETKDTTDFKPILRNLSDLTKEIEVNGEKFVPIEKFCEIEDCRTLNNIDFTKFGVEEIIKNGVQYDDDFGKIQKLFEWHFDVFGLIENNLAIDINTLK